MCECRGTQIYCLGLNLAQIPSNIPKNTTVLDLSGNQISAINATSLSGLTSLEKITFNVNEISSIDAGAFSDLQSLERLFLENNKISSIDANLLSGLTSLEDLILDNNEISSIEDGAFSDLGSLSTLSLYDNKISSIGAKLFSGLTSLKTLEISSNEITSIEDDAFPGLQSLVSLSLSSNKISRIEDGAFSDLQSLHFIAIENNNLTTVSANIFDKDIDLRALYLRDNPLICCTMADFVEWRQNQNNITSSDGTCTDFNSTTDIHSFNVSKCRIDGGWSSWVNSTCSVTSHYLPLVEKTEGSNEESLKCSLNDCPEACKESGKKPESKKMKARKWKIYQYRQLNR
ncbi:unnamed protein product [Mytilus coruscus]|nr:unnamed protein product [Mytilus coruscus]